MDETTLSEEEAFEEFHTILDKSLALLQLRKRGEMRKPILDTLEWLPPLPPLPRLPPRGPLPKLLSPDELKQEIIRWADVVDVVLCESLVVTAVTALEVYLMEIYRCATGQPWPPAKLWLQNKQPPRLLESVYALNCWKDDLRDRCHLDLDPFKEVDKKDINDVFQFRHVIVHRGGKVDKKAIEEGHLRNVEEGQLTKDLLTLERTRELLESVQNCANSIRRQYRQ